MRNKPKPRPYTQRARAANQENTRLRITEAAVKLHGSVGPARTSISAVAESAGVQRATLYRYFPDDEALFAACSAHWMAENPPPNVAAWAEISDPNERIAIALEELYSYYADNEAMLANLYRDESLHPAIPPLFAAFHALLDAATEILMAGRKLKGRGAFRMQAAVKLAIEFSSWRSLVRDAGLEQSEATAMMVELVANVE